MKKVFEKRKRLKSSTKSVQEIEPMLRELRNYVDIPDDVFYNILISATEAVNNAIIHGNRYDEKKKVIIRVVLKDHKMIIEVRDEGSGFEPEKLKDPRDPENLLKANGRGVFLIKTLMDDVEYLIDEKGTKLKMSMDLSKLA